jgi:hypothetical protein
LTNMFIDTSTVAADLYRLIAIALMMPHELDAAVAVLMVGPVHKWGDSEAGFLLLLSDRLG